MRVLTFNLRNVNDRYEERKPLLVAGFRNLAPDIAALQEVSFEREARQDDLLAASAGRPSLSLEARSPRYPDFGNAILVATGEVQAHELLSLNHGRVAQRALIALPRQRMLWVVNTHLHHRPLEPLVREAQARLICEWMAAAPAADAVVIAGDFNTPPFEPAYAVMTEGGYRSAYREANGVEPAVTWPSGIQAPTMDTDGEPNCLDYIWLRGAVRVRSARLVFDVHAPGDPTLYPSDHFGILAELDL
jgi:endonuclease/exonuclease/phosphatase family metal-dependent hydrolase